jgi:hypothetical protein
MATDHVFTLPLVSDGALKSFVRHAFGVVIPSVQVVEGHATPWQAFSDAYFARYPVSVWEASRGFGGKSYLLSLLSLTEGLTLKADVKILGGSGAQSKYVQDYISSEFYEKPHAPKQLWRGAPMATVSKFVWGNRIQALMASTKSTRGPHAPRLRCDEIDEMPLHVLDAAMGQTMAVVEEGKILIPAQTVLSSTHHYPDGTMTEVLRRADQFGWPVYKWSYAETSHQPGGWLLPSEVERKRGEITEAMWQVEYELQQPSAEGRAIMPQAIEQMFRPELGRFEGRIGEYIEIEPPKDEARYATGADWAKQRDFTVIYTLRIDERPFKLVAFERRQREEWPYMVHRFDSRVIRYKSRAKHDATGLGSVIDDYKISRSRGINLVGFTRKALFSNYIAAIEAGGIIAPEIEFLRKEHEYAAVKDLYGGGHPPDSIVAGALAYDASISHSSGFAT